MVKVRIVNPYSGLLVDAKRNLLKDGNDVFGSKKSEKTMENHGLQSDFRKHSKNHGLQSDSSVWTL